MVEREQGKRVPHEESQQEKTAGPAGAEPRGVLAMLRKLFGYRLSGVVSAAIVVVILSSITSEYFLTPYNITIIIRDLAFIGLVALGQTMVLLTGEIDLSVGAVAGLCAVTAGVFMVQFHYPPFLTVFAGIGVGALCGLINGLLVTKLRLNALVVTLGTMGIFSGLNLVVTRGKAITGIPKQIYFLGQGIVLGVPMPLVIMVAVLVFISVLSAKTAFGRHLYAIGDNMEAARLVGIRADRIKATAFVISGALSAMAGILMVARLGSAQPSIGQVWQLPSIAAAVIGGVALTGGVGHPIGSIVGAVIIGVIENIIILLGVSPYWQTVVSGSVVVIAISIDAIQRRISCAH
jgi:ribose transport system permease protein